MRRALFTLWTMAITLLVAVLAAQAAIVPLWSAWPLYTTFESYVYEFRATDATGAVVADGPHTMSFSIWDHVTAGTMLWSEVQTVTTSDGLGAVTLGAVVPVPLDIFGVKGGDTLSARYVEIILDGEVLSPRTRLRSVPYASAAERVLGDIETSNGELRVSNIGSSGLDGVAIDLSAQGEVGKLSMSPIGTNDSGGVVIFVDPDSSSLVLFNPLTPIRGDIKAKLNSGSLSVKVEKSNFKRAEINTEVDVDVNIGASSLSLAGNLTESRINANETSSYISVSHTGSSSQGGYSATAQLDSIIRSSYHVSSAATDSSVTVLGGGSVRRSASSSDGISITKVEDKATPTLYESLCKGSHATEQKETVRKISVDKDESAVHTYHVNHLTLDSAHYLSSTSAVGSRLSVSNLGSSGLDGVRCDLNVDNNSANPDSGKAGGLSILNLGSSGQDDISVHLGTSTDLTAPAGPVRRGRLFVGNLSFAGEDGVSIDVGPGASSVFRVGRLTPLPVVQGHQTAVVQGGATTSEFTDPGGAGGGGRIAIYADASQSQTTVSTIGAIAGDGVVSTATSSLVTQSIRSGGGAGGSIYIQAENFPQGGRIGVNNNSPVFEVDVVGSICATGGIGCPSDARLKKNVTEIRDALSVIAQLRGVRFDWRTDEFPDRHLPDVNQIGFIAQEMQRVVPEAVVEGADGYLALDYGRLTPILVEAIKQQQATISELQEKVSQIDQLSTQVNALSAKLKELLAETADSDFEATITSVSGE